jgi:tetratricopeptide (TPR) repeat protein
MWSVLLAFALALPASQTARPAAACEPGGVGIDALECAVEQSPDDVRSRVRLGSAYFGEGRWFEALTQYEAALGIEPANESVRLGIASVFLEAGLADEARQALDAAAAMFPASRLPEYSGFYYRLSEIYADRGRLGDARRTIEAAALHPGPVDPAVIQKRLGDFLKDLVEPEAARAAYIRALRLDPDSVAARMALAGLDLDQGRLDEALEGYLHVLGEHPELGDAYRGIAEAHFAANRFEDAATAAGDAVRLLPEAPGPHYVLGRALQMIGEEAAGRSELAEYERLQARTLAADHRDREVHAWQSDAIVRFYRGDPDGAVAVLEDAIDRYPGASDLYLSLGLLLSQSGRHADAVATYSALLDVDPEAAVAVAPHLARERRLATSGR